MDGESSEFKSKGGFKRIVSAFRYSVDGFRTAWQHEHAFRQELMVAVPATIVALVLPVSSFQKLALIVVLGLVLLVELMRALHNKTKQTVNLSVRQGDEIVYIDRAFSERSGMQVVRAIGGRGPLHLTSTGKLFLSIDEAKAIRAYATRTGLAGHNKNSITDLARLERELSLVRARGYARDNEELELGVRCMAAGIYDDSGKLVAGLSISAPADRLQEEWLEDLVGIATQISATLGHRPVAA